MQLIKLSNFANLPLLFFLQSLKEARPIKTFNHSLNSFSVM